MKDPFVYAFMQVSTRAPEVRGVRYRSSYPLVKVLSKALMQTPVSKVSETKIHIKGNQNSLENEIHGKGFWFRISCS